MIVTMLVIIINGTFREYMSIRSFCTQLSQMAGVRLDGKTKRLDFLVPFAIAAPDLFDVAMLESWFEENVRGPDFARVPGNQRSADGWWVVDKAVQRAWRLKAIAELHAIIGHIID